MEKWEYKQAYMKGYADGQNRSTQYDTWKNTAEQQHKLIIDLTNQIKRISQSFSSRWIEQACLAEKIVKCEETIFNLKKEIKKLKGNNDT